MRIDRFEDIAAWQSARTLTNLVYSLTRSPKFKRDLGLAGQIQRATVSIMANIAEGYDRQSPKDFAHFLNMAFASATEVKSHLYVALDQDYISQQEFDSAYALCTKTSRMIFGFIKYLKGEKTTQTAP
jgi:four helix bundle protein